MTDLEKRLIVAMGLGIRIEHADGHRWIHCETAMCGYNLSELLAVYNVSLNGKIYGGVAQALDCIDAALATCGQKSLLENYWYDDDDILSGGVDESRIDTTGRFRGLQ